MSYLDREMWTTVSLGELCDVVVICLAVLVLVRHGHINGTTVSQHGDDIAEELVGGRPAIGLPLVDGQQFHAVRGDLDDSLLLPKEEKYLERNLQVYTPLLSLLLSLLLLSLLLSYWTNYIHWRKQFSTSPPQKNKRTKNKNKLKQDQTRKKR